MAVNTLLCYHWARPIPNLGIVLPFFMPPLVALLITWLGLGEPEFRNLRAPVAFVIGITGPLLGADLLHWKDFKRIDAGTVSIGGAGTWDGIVLSGLLAALLEKVITRTCSIVLFPSPMQTGRAHLRARPADCRFKRSGFVITSVLRLSAICW